MKVYIFYSEPLKLCWACLAESQTQAQLFLESFTGQTKSFVYSHVIEAPGAGILYTPFIHT